LILFSIFQIVFSQRSKQKNHFGNVVHCKENIKIKIKIKERENVRGVC